MNQMLQSPYSFADVRSEQPVTVTSALGARRMPVGVAATWAAVWLAGVVLIAAILASVFGVVQALQLA